MGVTNNRPFWEKKATIPSFFGQSTVVVSRFDFFGFGQTDDLSLLPVTPSFSRPLRRKYAEGGLSRRTWMVTLNLFSHPSTIPSQLPAVIDSSLPPSNKSPCLSHTLEI
jgi:hypothetical protein